MVKHSLCGTKRGRKNRDMPSVTKDTPLAPIIKTLPSLKSATCNPCGPLGNVCPNSALHKWKHGPGPSVIGFLCKRHSFCVWHVLIVLSVPVACQGRLWFAELLGHGKDQSCLYYELL